MVTFLAAIMKQQTKVAIAMTAAIKGIALLRCSKMSKNLQEDLARFAKQIDEQARRGAKFSRLSREERERAFQVVKARQKGYAVVHIEDMIDAYEELTGKAL